MPYIPNADRVKLDPFLTGAGRNIDTKGELTYALTRLVLDYVDNQGKSYDAYSDVLGCLTATTHEVYRTEVAKYESAKQVLSGPVVRPFRESVQARRCPCGNGVDRCESGDCIGSEGTTDGGW